MTTTKKDKSKKKGKHTNTCANVKHCVVYNIGGNVNCLYRFDPFTPICMELDKMSFGSNIFFSFHFHFSGLYVILHMYFISRILPYDRKIRLEFLFVCDMCMWNTGIILLHLYEPCIYYKAPVNKLIDLCLYRCEL